MKYRFFLLLAACAAVVLWNGSLAASGASAEPSPIKIAVFDFELEDFSAGAGVAGNASADVEQLSRVTVEARGLIAQSGRYVLVDVASADGEAVRGRWLRQCNGCEAAIALNLGADQSFVGVVARISRTEYLVRFQVRDARTGDLVRARQSGVRLGADYSWSRGAVGLINDGLLNPP
jgi:Protein of unknown function (DUF2380)